METPINEFLTTLTKNRKAILIGGLAVIAHGLSRGTKDADIWLEPMASAEDWLQVIQDAICNLHERFRTVRNGLPRPFGSAAAFGICNGNRVYP